ncbi:hypothetical protein [Streptomyces sp. NPDC048243]
MPSLVLGPALNTCASLSSGRRPDPASTTTGSTPSPLTAALIVP